MCESSLIKRTRKILTAPQYGLLKQLAYWISHKNEYGVFKDGKVWIYNTYEQWAEQLNVSASTVCRGLNALKDLNFICSAHLSPNKRNRTLYYSINFSAIKEFFEKNSRKKTAPVVHSSVNSNLPRNAMNDVMDDVMYITNNKIQINNISNKSHQDALGTSIENQIDSTVCRVCNENYSDTQKIISANDSQTVVSENSPKTQAAGTTCQDMMKILKEELFENQEIRLTKPLARYLVASFKTKFSNNLDEWKRYLRLIKTSSYMMSEKFTLSVKWILKFETIDRIRAGELGVDESKIPVDVSEIEQKALDHIESLDESENCKKFRHEIIKKLSPRVYISWFTKVDLIEEAKQVVIKAANSFVKDYIKANFSEKLSLSSEILFCK